MNLPGETSNDRRAVPRHIRDGEHDMLDETLGQVPPRAHAAGLRTALWICLLVLAAGGFGLWMALRQAG